MKIAVASRKANGRGLGTFPRYARVLSVDRTKATVCQRWNETLADTIAEHPSSFKCDGNLCRAQRLECDIGLRNKISCTLLRQLPTFAVPCFRVPPERTKSDNTIVSQAIDYGTEQAATTPRQPRLTLSTLSLLCVRFFIRCITIITVIYTADKRDRDAIERQCRTWPYCQFWLDMFVTSRLLLQTVTTPWIHRCAEQFIESEADRYLRIKQMNGFNRRRLFKEISV